ncbi:MAG: hypothetical protein R3A49_14240 [Acidimicrobiia bacterium]
MSHNRNTGRLSGRVVVVTGTGTPQGRAGAVALAREGAAVVAVDIDADAAAATVAEIHATASDSSDTTAGGATGRCAPVAVAFVGDPDDPTDAAALVEMVAEIYPDG